MLSRLKDQAKARIYEVLQSEIGSQAQQGTPQTVDENLEQLVEDFYEQNQSLSFSPHHYKEIRPATIKHHFLQSMLFHLWPYL